MGRDMSDPDRGPDTDEEMWRYDCARYERDRLACDAHLADLRRVYGRRPPEMLQPARRLPKRVVAPTIFPNRETLATVGDYLMNPMRIGS
jgi:hypothetical protein